MRKKVLLFLGFNCLVVGLLVNSVWPLLCLLVVDGTDDGISRAELPAPNSPLIDQRPQVIPKIIHQTYITCDVPSLLNNSCTTGEIPKVWKGPQQSCKDLHGDYEYKLWTDKNSREFIVNEYPWFIETWDSYLFPIQRADAIRYFALRHYGGIYIDLDDGCKRRLDPLLSYPAWVRRTNPTGIGNDVFGAVPGHPFLLQVIDALPNHARNWMSPYITIMGSTGPLFFSLIWRLYNSENHPDEHKVRMIFTEEYMGNSWSFFSHHKGNSWHMWDAQAIFWMGAHWIELTLFGFGIAGLVFFGLWWVYNRATNTNKNTKSQAFRSRIPFWRRISAKEQYELIDRHQV